jgi:methionine synthase II (cobalamin-independent)
VSEGRAQLLPTTMVGSYPRSAWFRDQLEGRDIREAVLAVVPAERVTLTTDCGMKPLPRPVARAKLRSLVAGAAIVRHELAG